LTICPSCGSTVERDLCAGCQFCGARAIGPPLARPEHQLNSYGHAVAASVTGALMLVVFMASLVGILIQNKGVWFQLSAILTAGEVAAWRLKWIAPPVALIVLWFNARSIRTIKFRPEKFAGLRIARSGFMSAIFTTTLIATLIGVTVPERLRRHQWAVEAETNSRIYTLNRALLEFKEQFGTYPSELKDLEKKLPDPYGLIADAVRNTDATGYQPSTVVAAASTKVKPLSLRGGALRNAPSVEPATDHAVSFTNYDLRLAGEDKVMFTDDDLIVHDGVIMAASELSRPSNVSNSRTP